MQRPLPVAAANDLVAQNEHRETELKKLCQAVVHLTKMSPNGTTAELAVHEVAPASHGSGQLRTAEIKRDKEMTRTLFSAFPSTKPKSVGVGPSIRRAIVEQHKGKIWAQALPVGTASCFTLPSGPGEHLEQT